MTYLSLIWDLVFNITLIIVTSLYYFIPILPWICMLYYIREPIKLFFYLHVFNTLNALFLLIVLMVIVTVLVVIGIEPYINSSSSVISTGVICSNDCVAYSASNTNSTD